MRLQSLQKNFPKLNHFSVKNVHDISKKEYKEQIQMFQKIDICDNIHSTFKIETFFIIVFNLNSYLVITIIHTNILWEDVSRFLIIIILILTAR